MRNKRNPPTPSPPRFLLANPESSDTISAAAYRGEKVVPERND